MLLDHHTNFAIVLTILIIACATRAQNITNCHRHCGGKSLQYPFGFSEGCEVQLNCINDQVQIGHFLVQNVTTSSIVVSLPAKCNRNLQLIVPLFSNNFAPTWNNSFLLQNCTGDLGDCVIPAATLIGRQSCESSTVNNISCFTQKQNQDGVGVVRYEGLEQTGCKFLFSAVAIVQSAELSLQFQVVELGWWLQGQCGCSPDASCTVVSLPGRRSGFRCRCLDGFEGDGFVNGTGCWRGINDEDEDENGDSKADKLENWGFYFVFIAGFATGLWGVIGTLMFNKSWRHAYFRWLEDVADKIHVAFAIKVRKIKLHM